MEITGHKTRSVFDRYHIVDTQDVSNAMQQWEDIRKEWRKACAAVGLGPIIAVEGRPYDPRYEGLTLHDFRRSAIRNLATLAGVVRRSQWLPVKISYPKRAGQS
jgi:hypothetical protein